MKAVEVWKDIPGYETLYQVSNFGRVKSYERNGTKGGILKPTKNKLGYMRIGLSKSNKKNYFSVHRLVALTFIPNPYNLPIINHKNEIKHDNRVENLEWCTHEYNNNYGTIKQKISKSLKGKYSGENHNWYGKHHTEETKIKISESHKGKKHTEETKQKLKVYFSKPILQYTKDMIFIREWESGKLASEILNINYYGINNCCNGRTQSSGGYIWKYK